MTRETTLILLAAASSAVLVALALLQRRRAGRVARSGDGDPNPATWGAGGDPVAGAARTKTHDDRADDGGGADGAGDGGGSGE